MVKHNGQNGSRAVLDDILRPLVDDMARKLEKVAEVDVRGRMHNIHHGKHQLIYLLPAYSETDRERKTQTGFYAFFTKSGRSVKVYVKPKPVHDDPGQSMATCNRALVQYALAVRRNRGTAGRSMDYSAETP